MIKIKDTEHYYINECGTIYSYARKTVKIIKPYYSHTGYLMVSLQYNRLGKGKLVHRLVAEAYLPNPSNLPFVCHKDDNPANPHRDNLYWGTHQDNMNDRANRNRTAKGPDLSKGRSGSINAASKPLIINNIRYETIKEASKSLGLHKHTIRKYANNKMTGYQWA
jgi:HNH endonuclease